MSAHKTTLLTSVVVTCPHNETPFNIILSFLNVSAFENEKNGLEKGKRRLIVY